MEAAEAASLIRARVPELLAGEIDRVEAALNGEEVLPAGTLAVILALIERLEARFDALEAGTAHRVM
jgi:hypothetical protein